MLPVNGVFSNHSLWGAEGAVAPGHGRVDLTALVAPPFGLLALGLPLAVVVLVRGDLNRPAQGRTESTHESS
jgi:hypothetical protein